MDWRASTAISFNCDEFVESAGDEHDRDGDDLRDAGVLRLRCPTDVDVDGWGELMFSKSIRTALSSMALDWKKHE